MTRVALLTTGVMVGRETDPRMRGFFERLEATFAAAEGSPGFCAAAGYDEEDPWHAVARPPIFAGEKYAGRIADTLSVWVDLEAVYAFAYNGIHARALRKRREWFVEGQWPSYVAWWVDDDQMPTWDEAYARHARLQLEGATPAAFTFKEAFDAAGRPYRIDRAAVMRRCGGTGKQGIGGEMTRAEIATLLEQYSAAWSETDGEARRALLEAVWHERGEYTDPVAHAGGREELDRLIGHFLGENPGVRFTFNGQADYHHDSVRFFWTLHFGNGTEMQGMDYGEIGADGKLRKIVGFF